jgi:release factor H-coupled RctB family protein
VKVQAEPGRWLTVLDANGLEARPRQRMRERFGKDQLVHTALGGQVICGQRNLLYEEAPAAYKNIEAVIQDLVDTGLVSVIAAFRPLLTYKTRKACR